MMYYAQLLHPCPVLLWYVVAARDAIDEVFGDRKLHTSIISEECRLIVSEHWCPTDEESRSISGMLGRISIEYASECREFMDREVRLHGLNCDLIWAQCLAVSSQLAMQSCPEHPRFNEFAMCHRFACQVLKYPDVISLPANADWQRLVDSYHTIAAFEELWELSKHQQRLLQ
ncbi:MAG: hypothetical protein JNK05_39125 [Myxococcales bacterium]|nr:hypothetical protein [Myxococcales bacterium]